MKFLTLLTFINLGVCSALIPSQLRLNNQFQHFKEATISFTHQEKLQHNENKYNHPYLTLQAKRNENEASISITSDNQNPFTNIISSFLPTTGSQPPQETEEERLFRLEQERREILAEAEVNRQVQVKKDAIPYFIIVALQFLPLLGTERVYSIIYFLGLAISTVYVGGRQETLEPPEKVTKENALYAPVGASISIGLLYVLLKNGLDPTSLYAVAVSLFGALAISDVGVPILRNVLPNSFAETELEVPEIIASKIKLNPATLPLDGVVTLLLGIVCTAVYWAPIAMTQKFIVSNGKQIHDI